MSAKLTRREHEIMILMANERSTKEIASELGISNRTVESHRFNLYAKLNCKSPVGVTRHAIARGLVSLAEEGKCSP
jgi:two-component system nitrate/nitrite response regulator NarL